MRSAAHLSIESMCRLGQVSRAGFYRHWKQREPCAEELELRARMQQIVLAHRRNYGYRRVTHELRQQGWAVNHKRVARLMAEDSLLCLRRPQGEGGGLKCSSRRNNHGLERRSI
jgi:putative transposase